MISSSETILSNSRFFKNIKWSPGGSKLLANSADNILRIMGWPENYEDDSYLATSSALSSPNSSCTLVSNAATLLQIKSPESIYDFSWYPHLEQHYGTSCFAGIVRNHPLHLWNAVTGEVTAKYEAYDNMEQVWTPNSLTFNLDGSQIYCGFKNTIMIFDTQRPGRDFERILTSPIKSSREGQKGIISCISFSPDNSGLFAAGSYSDGLGLYDGRSSELLHIWSDLGGLTQATFSPDGCCIFAASRLNNSVICLDIRNTGGVLYSLERLSANNQKIQFDLTPDGTKLLTGDQDGYLNFFDISSTADVNNRLVGRERAHGDVCSGVSVHPSGSMIATCSGDCRFDSYLEDREDTGMDRETSESTITLWTLTTS